MPGIPLPCAKKGSDAPPMTNETAFGIKSNYNRIEMKKISYFVAQFAILAAAAAVMPSCSGSSENNGKAAAKAPAKNAVEAEAPANLVIRYVDTDSIMANYNLAKDVTEALQRLESKFQSAQRTRYNELQQLGAQIEDKMKSNKYASESEYNADMARAQKKQQEAQNYLDNLQRTSALEGKQLEDQLNDSIQAYLKIFSEQNGYDAVLLKNAGLYFNPALDVTEEVVKGLNGRYNKVAK